jgi:hypothetical protein
MMLLPGRARAVTVAGMPDNLTDPSHSTAQFRAFVQDASGEPERSWTMNAPRTKVAILAGVVLVVALVIALISLAVA